MNLLERARMECTLTSDDFWLDLRGVTWRARRRLVRELRANLFAAAADSDARTAVRGLGSVKELATEAAAGVDRGAPRWSTGLACAFLAMVVVLVVEMQVAFAWIDGASTAAPDATVTGTLLLFPGAVVEYSGGPGTGGFAWQPGWLCLVAALTAFVLVARPWRAFRRMVTTP